MLDRKKFIHWLEDYGKCWESGNSDKLFELFSPDAIYPETPFDAPIAGLREIKQYWHRCLVDHLMTEDNPFVP